MPVETTGKAVDTFEKGFLDALKTAQPMKLSIQILEGKYKTELSDIVKNFEDICEHFKGKKIAKKTSLSTLATRSESLEDAKYINKTVKPFITTIKNKFGFDDNTTLENVCQYIIKTLTGMADVFDFNLTGTIKKIKKAYKTMTDKDAPTTTLNVQRVSKKVQSFLKAQTLISTSLKDRTWGSSVLTQDGDYKDDKYNDLKVSLGILNKKYQELKAEGDIAYKRSAEEIVTLYKQLKTFDHLELDTNVTKEELDKKVANFQNMQNGIHCNPYDSIKKFLKDVRNLEKGKETNNAGLVIITKKDAVRRADLLTEKHWGKIQTTFFEELIDSENNQFNKTLALIETNLLRSQRLEAQLITPVSETENSINKLTFNTEVNNYFTNIQADLTNTNATSTIDISFKTLKEKIDKINSNWGISQDVVYCIGYIYLQLSDFVTFLTTNIETATHMLKEANGTLEKKDTSKLKFGMDIYGKFATVAAFTGPLVNVSPIFAAIWGAIALSGTIVQIVQVVYNRHQAKKTAKEKASQLTTKENRDDPKVVPAEKQHDTVDGDAEIGDDRAEVETKTDNAEVTKLNDKISELKTLKKALTSQNRKLMSENKRYKQKVAELEAELAELKSANPQLSQNAVDAH